MAAAGVAVVLGAIAFLVLQAEVFYSIDGAVKFIQAEAFRTSGFRSMALPYPGQRIDPDGLFVPFEPPFVFRGAGQYQSIFPSAFAMLASLVVGLGPGALRALAIGGGALAADGQTRLLVISRQQPRDSTKIAPFKFAESWTVSRYWVGRWVR
jgi:hypothetical protein